MTVIIIIYFIASTYFQMWFLRSNRNTLHSPIERKWYSNMHATIHWVIYAYSVLKIVTDCAHEACSSSIMIMSQQIFTIQLAHHNAPCNNTLVWAVILVWWLSPLPPLSHSVLLWLHFQMCCSVPRLARCNQSLPVLLFLLQLLAFVITPHDAQHRCPHETGSRLSTWWLVCTECHVSLCTHYFIAKYPPLWLTMNESRNLAGTKRKLM